MNLPRRPRRNRRSPAIRALIRETKVDLNDLVQPIFLTDSSSACEPIPSLPGVNRMGIEVALRACEEWSKWGIKAIAPFPVFPPSLKNPEASAAGNPDNFFLRDLTRLRRAFPNLVFFVDVALDPYTDHGHDGLLDNSGKVENDRTVEALCTLAKLLAATGIDYVAPSDMMDGRIGAIRQTLDEAGFTETGILSYAAKFASACYGPFRDAVGSSTGGYLDKGTYQMDPANAREARMELALDYTEGADIVMIKPANWYGDLIAEARHRLDIPIAAYQVSGEYAMIHAAAERGWMDLRAARDESLLSIKRAGADLIFSYFTAALASESKR